MKKTFVLLFLIFSLSATLFAQEAEKQVNPEVLREKLFTKKKAIYIERLELTKEEAKKFLPIYEQYDKEVFNIKGREFKVVSKIKRKKLSEIDAETAEEFIKVQIETDEAINNLNKKYYELFKTALPPQKVAKFILEENKVMRELLQEKRQKEK